MLHRKLFFLFCAILSFSFALNPTTGVDLPVVRILAPAIFVLWLIHSLAKRRVVVDPRVRFWLFAIFLFICTLSVFVAMDQARAIRKILFLLSFFPLYFVVFDVSGSETQKLLTLKILCWGAGLLSFFAIALFSLQFIIGIDPTLEIIRGFIPIFLGNTFGEIVSAFPSWLVNVGGKTVIRSFGTFPDPHLFALYINLLLPIALYLYLKSKERKFLVFFVFMLLASLLSFSRAAYLALLVGGLFLFTNSRPLKILNKTPLLALAGFVVMVFLFIFPNPLMTRFVSSFNFSEGSNSGRIEMWEAGLEIIRDEPFLGVGIGNFSRIVDPMSNVRSPIYAHNLFLDFGSETGVANAVLLLIILMCPIASYFKYRRGLSKFVAVSFVILLAHSIFETPFYSVRVFPLVLILLALNTKNDYKF